MKRLLLLAALAMTFLPAAGCLRAGYHHTHPAVSPDGAVRTIRHWHRSTGYAGYHPHPFPNEAHKEMMMNQRYAYDPKRLPKEEDE